MSHSSSSSGGSGGRGRGAPSGEGGSGRFIPENASSTYCELAALFQDYISPILVHSTLSSALTRKGLAPSAVRPQHTQEIVESAMVGMRLFCDPARLPMLMISLAEHCDRLQASVRAGRTDPAR